MAKLPSLGSAVPILDQNIAPLAPKVAAPIYSTPEYKRWRTIVIDRADGRCEWEMPDGSLCGRKEPRMFADHIDELRDDGAAFDPANGQCLCGAHHTLKTNVEAKRRALG